LLSSLIRWLEILVFGVFTYQQTQSAAWVASMTMLRMLPMGLFGVLFGSVAARISRRTGLIVTQSALLLTTLCLLTVSALGALEVWHLAVASFISGTAWAGDMPMRRGLIGDIAGHLRMGQAMALDAVANNGCRLLGPSLGGLLLAYGGMTAVFVFAALLYVPVLTSVLTLADRPASMTGQKPSISSMLIGGVLAARDNIQLRSVLCITIIFNLFAWPVLSMVPVIGQERLHLSTQNIGLLASMDGFGALIGALVLMAVSRRSRYGHLYVGGVFVFLMALPIFAQSVNPFMTAAALLVVGIGQSGFGAMQATLVYVSAPQDKRAEALGLLTMCIGIAPLGFLMVGWLAGWLGASTAAVICALCGLVSLGLTWPVWRRCLGEPPAARVS
jgi:MFS family permease